MRLPFPRVSPLAWTLAAYAVMISIVLWSLTQPTTDFTIAVFFISTLTIWVPAYAYVNRGDIARNKVFWFSQSAALLVACSFLFVIGPWLMDAMDAGLEHGRRSGNWIGIATGFGSWLAAQSFFSSIARTLFDETEKRVEKTMLQQKAKQAADRA